MDFLHDAVNLERGVRLHDKKNFDEVLADLNNLAGTVQARQMPDRLLAEVNRALEAPIGVCQIDHCDWGGQ
jgi:hypothetical protein